MLVSMLTTVDNPHDPFDDFDAWYQFDTAAGYNTSGLLARIAMTSDELSEAEFNSTLSQAIDEIVKENVLGIFRKVTRDIPNPLDASG